VQLFFFAFYLFLGRPCHFTGAAQAWRCCRTLRAGNNALRMYRWSLGEKRLTTSGFSRHRPPASLLIRSALCIKELGIVMDKKLAKSLVDSITRDIKTSNTFSMVDHRKVGRLKGFHAFANDKPCFGAFLISDNSNSYWILVIEWRDDGNYYVVVYPENHQQAPLAELHKVERHSDGLDLKWLNKTTGQNNCYWQLGSNLFGPLIFFLRAAQTTLTTLQADLAYADQLVMS